MLNHTVSGLIQGEQGPPGDPGQEGEPGRTGIPGKDVCSTNCFKINLM